NRTNVRQDSDVDICVLCRDVFYYDLPAGVLHESYGITPANYEYAQFKNEVGAALSDYFGYSAVTRGNKAFDVHANSYRVDADVVPAFEYRRYTSASAYHEGTKFLPDGGREVINWPSQNYENGVVPKTANHPNQADQVITFVKADSDIARTTNAAYAVIRETERPKWLPSQIVGKLKAEGFPRFRMSHHTDLWKSRDAKNTSNGYGVQIAKTWYWYDTWLTEVRKHCNENAGGYR
ncbi:MAG: nucleotidyltransferase domain-containing protein, partial [Gammaproteobacteria bacterium]